MITKTAERTALSRATIVDRALALADLEGTDAITVRRLAQEFGVTPMALYWHVKNKDELLAAMGDRFFDEIPAVPASGTWTERLRAVMASLVESLRQHPASAHLAGPRVLQCPPGQELAEQTLALLRAAGFSVTRATDIARTAMQTAIMLVTEQAGA
ncbi:MAG: TetR/AcrR family transcriptional regulator, partial [Jatrophihabitantaceae bacterium]